jgi:hypothetical protein
LALRKNENQLHVTLVECETKPNKKRLSKKMFIIQNNLSLQKQLHQKTKFRPLLIIPPFNLSRIFCSEVRKFWEIWIINHQGNIKHKINPIKTKNEQKIKF